LKTDLWRPIHCPKQQRGDSANSTWVARRANATNRPAGAKLRRAKIP
jgi:hypothetical protein